MAKRKATKRLGRLQKTILKCLRKNGAAMLSSSLAWEIHNAKRKDWEDTEQAPRSLDVSVRRAIHTLAKRGLVCVGIPDKFFDGRLGVNREPRHGCVCWLPKHDAPDLVESVPGNDVRAAVLAELEGAGGEWVNYRGFTMTVIRRIDPGTQWREGWASVAVSRAVRKLADEKVIEWRTDNHHLRVKRLRLKQRLHYVAL